MDLPTVTVEELRHARDDGAVVLDVREVDEVAICALEGALHIPMGEIPQRWQELRDLDAPIHCLCHHGMRSAQVAAFLRQRGVEAVNVAGGIDAWATAVDPAMARY